MNLKSVPPRVRGYMYIAWTGMALGALGVLGFVLSFWQVGSVAVAEADLAAATPWFAYISIFVWLLGLGVAWYGRRKLDAAVRERKRELADAARVELD
ncbi:MAG: hypothetical protein D9V44_07520 [Actinobacteria bacterium]|nr:MAG: hypothetical protein D9V44_07520 [Actinomycetota bacterium]